MFFKSFKWAVPAAFSDAISMCAFNEGDFLYDSVAAYEEPWLSAVQKIDYSLQVKYVEGFSLSREGTEAQQFLINWNSRIRVDLFREQERVYPGQIETTQGRLYTMLWKGAITILDEQTTAPIPPVLIRDITKRLGEVTLDVSTNNIDATAFMMCRDNTNPVSREKYQKIYQKLNKFLSSEPQFQTPIQVGFKNADLIAPTIEIAIFKTTGITASAVHDLVKCAVYSPAKNAARDMFRLNAHGVIVS